MEDINNTELTPIQRSPEPQLPPIETPITPEPIPPKSNLFKYLFIISILVLLIVVISFIFILKKTNSNVSSIKQDTNIPQTIPTEIINQTTPVTKVDTINYDVETKKNSNDSTKTDIYLKNIKTNIETLFMTLDNVFIDHYHNSEYHNGSLYVIKRTGSVNTNSNWTDELWRYNSEKQGQKLFSVKGLDFRVSDDENFIAISGDNGDGSNTHYNLTFIKNDGSVLRVFNLNQLGLGKDEGFRLLEWGNSNFWLTVGAGPLINSLIRIEATDFQIKSFDISNFSFEKSEFSLNTTKEKIVFSNYPAMFDVDSAQEFSKTNEKINLTIYDLNSKTSEIIATSTAQPFKPIWINENTVEYQNPSSNGKLTKQIP